MKTRQDHVKVFQLGACQARLGGDRGFDRVSLRPKDELKFPGVRWVVVNDEYVA